MITITPATYHSNSHHRQLADAAMAAADVSPNDVVKITQTGNFRFDMEVYVRDRDGNISNGFNSGVVTTIIQVDTLPPLLAAALPVPRDEVIGFREVQPDIWSVEIHNYAGDYPTKFIIVHTGA